MIGQASAGAFGRAITAALAIASIALLLPADAPARSTQALVVVTSSGARCHVNRYGPSLECFATFLEDPGNPHPMLDVYLELKTNGEAGFGERGDYSGYVRRAVRLHHGDYWRPRGKWKGISCQSRPSGFWCKNRDAHGFRLSRSVTERF